MTTSPIGVNGKWRLDAFARGNDFDLWTGGSSDQIVSWFSKPCSPVTVPANNTTGLLALFSKSTQTFFVQLKLQTSL